jgi:hypothetical protein
MERVHVQDGSRAMLSELYMNIVATWLGEAGRLAVEVSHLDALQSRHLAAQLPADANAPPTLLCRLLADRCPERDANYMTVTSVVGAKRRRVEVGDGDGDGGEGGGEGEGPNERPNQRRVANEQALNKHPASQKLPGRPSP